MSLGTIATITKREVKETLTDWRILLPVFLLTFLLPQLLIAASRLVIRFVEDPALVERLMPFAALLVGFIPSSFSLITALESFVGERERNSLESLLAMPISDNELFTSKLCSSLLTPLLASYTAMLVFTFMLYVVDPAMYVAAITPMRLLLLFLMVGLLALAMVAGAVVISTQTSSIRAANLLSSLVLLPASMIVQGEAFLIINGRWDMLWLIVVALAVLATILVRSGMVAFNREGILAREHQQLDLGPLTAIFGDRKQREQETGGKRQELRTRKQGPFSNIARIAGREIYEVATDWRVLVPIFILTMLVPLGLVAAVPFAINFLGDTAQIIRLVPFAIMLVGFVPCSFSLITALESFVGERERNSLESLLAMPVADNELYISKLISSLMTPLVTSYCAMLVFAAALAVGYPELYFGSMDGIRLLQLLVMLGTMTVVMVAGAVIISSHTSSIRAATLLASGVLIPMSVVLMMESVLVIAQRWDVMWIIIMGLVVVAIAFVRTGMATFNREEILSREHEQISIQRINTTFQLFFREYQPAGVSPDDYQGVLFSPRRFYRHELPALLRELRLPILVALVAAVAGMLGGGYVGSTYRIRALESTLAAVEQGYSAPPGIGTALGIFAQNVRVSLLSPLFSIFCFGLFAFLIPAVAFASVGFVGSTLQARGGSWLELGASSPLQFVLGYVAPHGIIELPTFILCAAMGIRIGAALLSPPKGFTVAQNILWSLANFFKVWLLLLLPLILAGSLVEGLVSPLIIQALYAK